MWLGKVTCQLSVCLWLSFFLHINNYFILHFFFFFSLFKVRLRDFNISEVSKHPWQWVLNKDSWAVESAAFSVKVKLLWACFYAAADPFKNRDKFAAWILKGHATVSLEHFIGSVHVCYRIQGNLLCSVNCLHWKWKICVWLNGQHLTRRHATVFPMNGR